jgi:hypothetical protein
LGIVLLERYLLGDAESHAESSPGVFFEKDISFIIGG